MKFYIVKNDMKQGPYEVAELIMQGLDPDTLVWTKGMPDWAEASTVPELAQAIRPDFDDAGTPPELPGEKAIEVANEDPIEVEPPVYTEPAPAFEEQPPVYQPQQPVQAPVAPQKKSNGTKWLIATLIAVAVIALLVCTKPSRRSHVEATSEAIVGYMTDRVDSSFLKYSETLSSGTKLIGTKAIEQYIDINTTEEDYFLFNITKIEIGGKRRTVGLGILGHVFTFDKEDVAKAVSKYFENKKKDAAEDKGSVRNMLEEAQRIVEKETKDLGIDEVIEEKIDTIQKQVVKQAEEWVDDHIDELVEELEKKIN